MLIVYCIAKTHGSGGMERVLSFKANFLVKKGYDVIIITTDQCGKAVFFPLDSRIRCYDLGINYEADNEKSFIYKIISYSIKQRQHKRKLSVLLKSLNADIVISMFCNDVSFIADIEDGSRKILELHFCKFKRLQYGHKGLRRVVDHILSNSDQKIVKKFDRFVVLTHEDNGYWGNLPNIEVIPNAIPFSEKGTAALINKKIIAIGRYDYQKGFDLLIEAWAIVWKTHPDWSLDIIGEGKLLKQLQQQIKDNNLQHNVFLLPPTKEIKEHYLKSSGLVMSSRYEGFGMVLLEAQSFGVPVISFECKCGPKDIISHGVDGYLVPEGDIEMLAYHINELINNSDIRVQMGEAAKENSTRFSQSQVMSSWIKLFQDLTVK